MLLLGLKWVANKLAELGMLPSSVVQALGLSTNNDTSKAECCNNPNGTPTTNAPSKVVEIESAEQWKALTDKKEWILVKFTATWCKPCKAIAPKFAELSTQYQAHFCEIDVDDLDEIASNYKVAMMPTFVWLLGPAEMGRMTGSNQGQLEQLVDKHLSKRP